LNVHLVSVFIEQKCLIFRSCSIPVCAVVVLLCSEKFNLRCTRLLCADLISLRDLFPVYAGVGPVLVFLFPLPVLLDLGSFSSPCGVPAQAKFLFLGLREHSFVSRFYSATRIFCWVYRGSQCWSLPRFNFSCARCSDRTPSRDFIWHAGSCCRIDFLSLLVASLDFCFQPIRSSRCPLCFSSRSGSCVLGGSSWLHLSVQCSYAPVAFFCCWFSVAGGGQASHLGVPVLAQGFTAQLTASSSGVIFPTSAHVSPPRQGVHRRCVSC
jgi:hypothetical protein